MRVYFNLQELEPFYVEFKGAKYPFASLKPLAQKKRLSTNISEFVYQLPTGEFIYVTIVGDEDQTSGLGIHRGWYIVEELTPDEAKFMIDALVKFSSSNYS